MARGRQLTRLKKWPLGEVTARYLQDWDAKLLHTHPESFPKLTSKALFGDQRPLEVEIGAGTGEYIAELASQKPGSNFLGVEVSYRAASYAAALAAEKEANNLRVLRANFLLLAPLLVPNSWQRVYLHFPDPVHKHSDEKRNVFTVRFLDAMHRALVPGGEISVASDKPDFFMKMLKVAEADARFEKVHSQRYMEGLESSVKSRFQRIWERKGVPTLRFVIRKK